MGLFYTAAAYVVPVMILVLFKRYWGARMLPLAVGMIAYMFISLFRGAARIIITDGMRDMPWMFYIFSALLSGIFEEVGRYVVFRWCLPQHDRWTDCIAYGFGHGMIEIILTTPELNKDFYETIWNGWSLLTIMAFSAAMSVLVFASVHHTESKIPLIIAIVLHTFIDIIPAMFMMDVIGFLSMWIMEPLYIFLCCYVAYRVYKKFRLYDEEPEWELYE